MSLEVQVMAWLRFEKRCPLVLFERTPRFCVGGRPDVIGVTKDRYLVEVEIKRTLSDFKANQKKRHVLIRHLKLEAWPKQFYFMVPHTLVEKVKPLLPDYAGLLFCPDGGGYMNVEVAAKLNRASRRLSIIEARRLVELQSNQLWAAVRDQQYVEPLWESEVCI
ncbi:MAG: hypothetical protein E6Q97_00135 [Desulfurellales bacterium]|nr:MAG: hypothetical protein E6Q97_00135 [Desulfurellales bacterium]